MGKPTGFIEYDRNENEGLPTGSPLSPQVHAFSQSAGHTLAVNSGKLFVRSRRSV